LVWLEGVDTFGQMQRMSEYVSSLPARGAMIEA